jgi:hypothetical protein
MQINNSVQLRSPLLCSYKARQYRSTLVDWTRHAKTITLFAVHIERVKLLQKFATILMIFMY